MKGVYFPFPFATFTSQLYLCKLPIHQLKQDKQMWALRFLADEDDDYKNETLYTSDKSWGLYK